MTYSCANFFAFFAAVLIAHRILPQRIRYLALLAASLVFYLFLGVGALFCVIISSSVGYLFAIAIEKSMPSHRGRAGRDKKKKSRAMLSAAIVLELSLLLLFRSSVFFMGYAVAVGSSFYVLRIISYLCDVYRQKVRAERNILKLTLFTAFFPLALQGPFARYGEVGESLFGGRKADRGEMCAGTLRILWGLFKKLVVADTLASPVVKIVSDTGRFSGAYVLLLIILYSTQIYCDFTGGIDVALGTSQMLGIGLPENFDRPFSSQSVKEFWNRWHITLGAWFEEYVFYPFSLSRMMQKTSRFLKRKAGNGIAKRVPVYAATLLTWSLTGLWHGAREHYIAWGLLNGAVILISEELFSWRRKGKRAVTEQKTRGGAVLFRCTRTFFIVGAIRLLDVYRSTPKTFKMLGSIFCDIKSYISLFGGGIFEIGLSLPQWILVSASVAVISIASSRSKKGMDDKQRALSKGKPDRPPKKLFERPLAFSLCVVGLILVIAVFGNYGIDYDPVDFIYSRF